MTLKLNLPLHLGIDQAIEEIKFQLVAEGWQLHPEPSAMTYCVLRCRSDANHSYTKLYHGLTNRAKVPRSYLSVSGPEQQQLIDLLSKQRAESK